MKKNLPPLAACAALLLGGCAAWSTPFRPAPPQPGRTTLGSPLIILPAQALGHLLVVDVKLDRAGPYHFLVDTGSTVTLLTPALAKRHAAKDAPPPGAPPVRVRSAEGETAELPPATLRRLELGEARFDDVAVLVYDCAPLSAHLGVKIDGVLGFPLFRETLLTLDYPHNRVLVQPANTTALIPGTTVPLDDSGKTPLIRIRLGDRTIIARVDSGSDAPLSLNPVGLELRYAAPPRAGGTVGTLTGDRPQQIGRLAETLVLGDFNLPRPIVDLTDELSAIGGEILKNFTVTFDQTHDRVIFQRDSHDPIVSPSRRSAGLSFNKTPAYWRIAGVVAASPAEIAGVQPGDLVVRVNGEPVAQWGLHRYDQLVATANTIAFTFLHGTTESEKRVPVFELVP
ncbi:MAG: hypothetical protein EXS32_05910 [Opitutus sp.]|nr:hypothetical protein [Opitutus sp.]